MNISRLTVLFGVFILVGCMPEAGEQATDASGPSTAANVALVEEVISLIDARELDRAFELYAEDYLYHGPGGLELQGRDGIRGLWMAFLTAMPDLKSTLHELIAKDDRVVLRWAVEGTNTGPFLDVPPSGNAVVLPITEIFRVENGVLVEAWDQWDRLHLARQIGGMPEAWQQAE